MTETARAVTNGQGFITGDIDIHNLKTDSTYGSESNIFKAKKKSAQKAKLGDLFSDQFEKGMFNLVAKHVESLGVNHATEIECGRTENKTIKFIETPTGWQFREQKGRIFSRKLEAA